MAWIIVGLGNPGEEYESTRHNAGRMAVEFFAKQQGFGGFHPDKAKKATTGGAVLEKTAVALVLPDTFMNKSGDAVRKFVKSSKAAERMIVVYDDLDLPLGKIKLSYDRGSGGHKGLESVIRAMRTKKFTRVRIGVSPETTAGNLRKPEGEKAVLDFLLTKFKANELDELKSVFKKVSESLAATVLQGPMHAMNKYN